MKIFFIMLLAANVACWGWQWNFVSTKPAPLDIREEPAFSQAPGNLILLSEMISLPRNLAPAIAPVASEVESTEQAATADLAPNLPDVSGQTVESSSALSVDASVGEPWCAVTNVLQQPQMNGAEKFLTKWAQVGGVGEIVVEEEPISSTWWVHLPQFASEAAARVVLSELQSKKIDSYYMRSGELMGGISLGVFSREESARKVQAELGEKGYITDVREIERMEDRSRLYVILEKGGFKTNESARQIVAEFASLRLEEIPCK